MIVLNQKLPNNGFIYTASLERKFLISAIYSAQTLRDYYPDAHITLYTENKWHNEDTQGVFNNVVYDAPEHKRAKLWALDKTPYDLTVYMDADVEIVHEDIQTIFDQMTSTADIMLTKIRGYNGKIYKFAGGELTDHCGLFMYKSNKKTITFMNQWWELYQKQASGEWKWDTSLYPEELRPWDQWTYWWLQNQTKYAIIREWFPDDARWNWINGYKSSETDKDIVVYHHTLSKDM